MRGRIIFFAGSKYFLTLLCFEILDIIGQTIFHNLRIYLDYLQLKENNKNLALTFVFLSLDPTSLPSDLSSLILFNRSMGDFSYIC